MGTKHYYLTTLDNPYSPITQFDEWFAYDRMNGYNCCGYLSRVVESKASDFSSLTQDEQTSLIRTAIQEIIKENVIGLYTMLTV